MKRFAFQVTYRSGTGSKLLLVKGIIEATSDPYESGTRQNYRASFTSVSGLETRTVNQHYDGAKILNTPRDAMNFFFDQFPDLNQPELEITSE